MFVLLVVLLLTLALYYCCTKNYNYWAKRNVKHLRPIPIFGNYFQKAFGMKSITELSLEIYNMYPDEKIVGYYRGRTPGLLIRDPDIIKHILSVDFYSFYQRNLGGDPKLSFILYSLFHSNGDIWKLLRHRLTPAFTTAKLKAMFPLIIKCAEKLKVVCENVALSNQECDVRELMARFTTEFIGACGFGVEMDTINNEHSMFRKLGKAMFTMSWKSRFLLILQEIVPEIKKYIVLTSSYVSKTLIELVKTIREQRNFKPIGRNDFMDLLLELETRGTLKGESIEHQTSDGKPIEIEMTMDLQMTAAQVFIFFAAGFETSSSTTSYTLHELAYHPEIQSKVQEEIDLVLSEHDNKLCYEAISKMTLLEMVFKESMRIFPSLGVLNRISTKRYTIPETDVTIDPGVDILIPVQAIHNDTKYYDNPNEFIPERFSPEAVKKRRKYEYLPFGEGPRACIGARLGLMQSLAGLAALLHKYSVMPSTSTLRKPRVKHSQHTVQDIQGGLPLKLRLREKNNKL